jgi:hypothetical protein
MCCPSGSSDSSCVAAPVFIDITRGGTIMKSLIAAVVATALAIPFAATAADKAASGAAGASGASATESMFNALDKNHDGFISREEVKGSAGEKDFAALDKNNDGKLSREEHAAASGGDKSPTSASRGTSAPSGGSSPGKGY